jgi:hypothetical protein
VKKFYSEAKWKRFTRNQQRRERIRRQSKNQRAKARKAHLLAIPKAQHTSLTPFVTFTEKQAPQNFSFINNTEEVIEFFNSLRNLFRKKKNVMIDSSDCTNLTPDTMTLLVSRLKDSTFTKGRRYRGNEPKDPKLAFIFSHSGFYDHIPRVQRKDKEQNFGTIKRKQSKVVEGTVAKELIQSATTALFGKRKKLGGVYRTLVDCMHNTIDHAHGLDVAEKQTIPYEDKEIWWATVYTDAAEKKSQFMFLDNGVGIFKSKNMGILRSIKRSLSSKTDAEILPEILQGKHTSRTGLPYRGKGLPGIYRALKAGRIRNLKIISNGVFADVANEKYVMMNE